MEEYIFETPAQEELRFTKESCNLLLSISKWSKFLSVFGFVILGIMVFMLLFTSILMSKMNHLADTSTMYPYMPRMFSWSFSATYLIILLVYFIPIFMLFKFSVNAKKAVEANNSRFLTQSLRFLDNHYKVIGILTLISIIFFVFSMISMFWGMRGIMM